MGTLSSSFVFFSSCLLLLIVGCTTTGSQTESEDVASEQSASEDSQSASTAETQENTSDDVTLDSGAERGAGSESANAPVESSVTGDASAPTGESAVSSTSVDEALAPVDANGNALASSETPSPAVASAPATEGAVETPSTADTSPDTTAASAAALASEQESTSDETSKDEGTEPYVSTPSVVTSTLDADTERREKIFGSRVFGSKRVQLAVNRPSFNEQQVGYELHYGKAKEYPTITGDWFPLDWWVNPGLSLGIGGYSVSGVAAMRNESNEIIADSNSKTNLLFVPIQGSFKIEMTPFRQKWIVLDGWIGYEYGWWQETTATSSSIQNFGLATDDTSTDTSKLTSKGVKTATVFGASAHILLNGLDQRTVRSMVSTMGISHVYLSPFFETVKTINPSGLTFGRNIYGIGFTFESVR